MKLRCIAVVENPLQRENLCQCIGILNATSSMNGDTVRVEVDYPSPQAEKLIELFEHYTRHEITTF